LNCDGGLRFVTTTRDRLLMVALDVFSEAGYEGASVREICKRAETNVASLNYHWSSKERLWQAVCEECARFFFGRTGAALAEGGSPAQVLPGLLDAVFDALLEDPRPIRILMWSSLQPEALEFEQTVQQFRPIVALAVRYLESARSAGEIGDVDIEVILPLFYGQLVFAFIDQAGHRLFAGKDFSDPAFAARAKRELLRSAFLLLGLPFEEPAERDR
jgi:AcrR family transcriptional regulator